ncbi:MULTISPECIES: 3-methyl-2-oxobutanoate hydroxymethyltransferase [Thiorhodovibrio]|uniref:3-methyl-2-oxobutanoate hydroxymethyltransferase n=1 Tax=Thiorhodovibrio TaxID=61593 RepID=UPI0019149DAC|nr:MULTISPECIES: 3-methyl-2-oxobutanoate hydroxymethyltransferase [Thiorhodovibrio]MBK5971005.1 3-methyl-2-oxobutanoate hydroxymethyltransferase [Thiorhodovibrio winogradskyi]WPL10629.1 3-methyl-2-oxobutanoate hydroxymethyltransferase [Thiorhodovibrio litoralis]
MEPMTLRRLATMKRERERIACLTCYDATFARLLEQAGVDVLLVGDSLGNVIQGQDSTLPVTLDDMVYHTACVARATSGPLLIADLPFLSYTTPAQTLESARRLMGEGGARMIKLEGGEPRMLDCVRSLSDFGVPVCAHLGLLPQSVHRLGGYRYQGRDAAAAERIRAEALALEQAGAAMLVLECVPAQLAAELTQSLSLPVIGIGAGPDCDGQVLVLHDMLGAGTQPRFSRDFLTGQDKGLRGAVDAYLTAVKCGAFPGPEQTLF